MKTKRCSKAKINFKRRSFEKVPCGKLKGKNWSSLSDRILLAALFCRNADFSSAHLDAVIRELMKRKQCHPIVNWKRATETACSELKKRSI